MSTFVLSGSNREHSIHTQLLTHVLEYTEHLKDTRAYEVPLYNLDDEEKQGIPSEIQAFVRDLQEHEHVIFATPEHNGHIPVSLKNILDWASRENNQFLKGKKILIISTSPGARGAQGANKMLSDMVPFFGASSVQSIIIPSYFEHVDAATGIFTDEKLLIEIKEKVQAFLQS